MAVDESDQESMTSQVKSAKIYKGVEGHLREADHMFIQSPVRLRVMLASFLVALANLLIGQRQVHVRRRRAFAHVVAILVIIIIILVVLIILTI